MALTNHSPRERSLPEWARWQPSEPYSIGVEEEVMILDPSDWTLAHETEEVFEELPAWLASHAGAETHAAVIELTTDPHDDMAEAERELSALRADLRDVLDRPGYRAAVAGTHPRAEWSETQVSSGARYQLVYESMRELARREPTFALHVHVGVPDAESAQRL